MIPCKLTVPLLALSLCLCGLAGAAPIKIVDVKVAGAQQVKVETILEAVKDTIKVGQEVGDLETALAQARVEVMRLGYFEEAGVTSGGVEGGVVVTITVRERLRVTKVSFVGNTLIPSDDLAKLIRTRAGLLLDRQILKRDGDRILAAYQDKGALAALNNIEPKPDGEVIFTLAEARLEAVRFEGLQVVTQKEAEEVLGVKAGSLFSNTDIGAGVRRLQDKGWFQRVNAAAEPGKNEQDAGVIITISVAEKPGVLPERLAAPPANLDQAKLRADVSIIKLDVQYQVSVQVNDFLLNLDEDVSKALPRLEGAAKGANASPDAQREYARALTALERKDEAAVQYGAAAAGYRQLLAKAPENVDLLDKLSDCLSASGAQQEALDLLRKAARLAPTRWEPRAMFADAAGTFVYGEFAKAMAAAATASPPVPFRQLPALRAVVELWPWENARKAALATLDTSGEPGPLVLLAREAVANLAEAQKLGPQEPTVYRNTFNLMLGGFFTVVSSMSQDPGIVTAIGADAATMIKTLGALQDSDPAIALWSAFFGSFQAVFTLAGGGTDASEDQINEQFRTLAKRLTEITEKWPRALRTSGSLLGVVQFLAGEQKLAKATFEEAIKQNPFDRRNYDALLGIAFDASDWPEMDRVVRRRMAAREAVEDYVLLGKIADRLHKNDDVLADFRNAIKAFPQEALGYAVTAGWLVHIGGNDAEAETLIEKALALQPGNAYALAVRCALRLVQGKPQEAATALTAALKAKPDEELGNELRKSYFSGA